MIRKTNRQKGFVMISAGELYEKVFHLSHTIGTRMAGSMEERGAADYMQEEFGKSVPKVFQETFPVLSQHASVDCLEVLQGGEWQSFRATLYNGAPTTGGELLTAKLVYFDSHTDYQRPDLSYLKGKAVLHYGASSPDEEGYERLIQAEPAFLLMVDTRYTNEVPLNDGLLPAQVAKYGAVPTMSISFFDAWKWCRNGATEARLRVSGENVIAESRNVIAEIPGTDPAGKVIYMGSHIDSVAGSPGADDNAIGCAILLAAAKELAKEPHRNTIRLIGFGSEEQLSVGSAAYVRRHADEIKADGRFMMNFDSCGSMIGWNKFVINAEEALREQLKEHFHARDIYYVEHLGPDPCNDLFPFTVLGVPGVTLMRSNCEAGKFFHHRYDNDVTVMSFDIAADLANASARFVSALADRDLSVFFGTEPSSEQTVRGMWRSEYGGFDYHL